MSGGILSSVWADHIAMLPGQHFSAYLSQKDNQGWRGREGVAWPLLSVLPCLDNTLLDTQHTA